MKEKEGKKEKENSVSKPATWTEHDQPAPE